MPRPISLFLVLALGLTAPAVLAAEPATIARPFFRLTRPPGSVGAALPGDTVGGNIVRAVEEIPERVFPSEDLTPEQEARRAAHVHERLLDCRPALVTPAAAQRVFDRLVAELPPRLKPAAFYYRLTVLDRPGRDAFTTGGGQVYVTRPQAGRPARRPGAGRGGPGVRPGGRDRPQRPRPHAPRLGMARRRRGRVAEFLPFSAARKVLAGALVCGAASRAGSSYTPAERDEADCFALHLCRNAGFDPDATLDPVRFAARGHLDDKEDGSTTGYARRWRPAPAQAAADGARRIVRRRSEARAVHV